MTDEKLDIYEDNYMQADTKKSPEELMEENQIKRVQFYLEKYEQGKAQMQERKEEWEEIHKAYKGERTDNVQYGEPNPVAVNIILSQVEGQVSSLMNNNITGAYKGVGYSDQQFARTAGIVGDFLLQQNNIKNLTKVSGRRYLQFGHTILTTNWDAEAMNDFGLPKMEVLKPGTLIIDDKITDIVADLQRADYLIHEVGSRSIIWARKQFGDEIADAIVLGNNADDFEYKDSDDDESFTYLRVWTRNNEQGNLQLLEISLCGILLSESEPGSPYYKHVFNKYPFFIAGLYKDESDSYYFGDGKVLLPMQKYINKLYDEILLAVKFSSQGRTYVDPTSGLNPAEFAQADPSMPIYVKNPEQTVVTTRGNGINEVVFNLLAHILDKVQETTRFSALMSGNDPSRAMTATQAGIQMQQGVTGIDDKKSDLAKALGECLNYSLGLCMEFWNVAKAFRVADNDEDFEWIDTRQLASIPELIPSSKEFKANFSKSNPGADEVPQYMQLQIDEETADEEGNVTTASKGATKQIDLDVIVNIGEGLPNNKIALYNMVLSLSQIVLMDEVTGQPRPLIGFKQFKKMVEQYLGIRIEDNQDEYEAYQQLQQERDMLMQQQGVDPSKQQSGAKPLNINPNIPGANLNGSAMGGGSNVLAR